MCEHELFVKKTLKLPDQQSMPKPMTESMLQFRTRKRNDAISFEKSSEIASKSEFQNHKTIASKNQCGNRCRIYARQQPQCNRVMRTGEGGEGAGVFSKFD